MSPTIAPPPSARPRALANLALASASLLLSIAGCASARFVLVRNTTRSPAVEIRQLHLQWSNVFLLRSNGAAMLVDTGSPGDWSSLVEALRHESLGPADLRVVVLTHGHADHAGLAARLQRAGVPVVLGGRDAAMASRGHDDPLRATSLFAASLRPLIDFPFTPFVPDVLVNRSMDLERYGIAGVRVEPWPGHTPGSVVLRVGTREAIVGDVMLGGVFGGVFVPGEAGEHYYQDDFARNHCNVSRLLDAGVERFYVGHGGPIERASVLEWQREWPLDSVRCRDDMAAPPNAE